MYVVTLDTVYACACGIRVKVLRSQHLTTGYLRTPNVHSWQITKITILNVFQHC